MAATQSNHLKLLIFYLPRHHTAPLAMARKSADFKLAPPTSAPSTSFAFRSDAALSGLTEPPYKMRVADPLATPKRAETALRIIPCTSATSPGVGVNPLPMAHTGS